METGICICNTVRFISLCTSAVLIRVGKCKDMTLIKLHRSLFVYALWYMGRPTLEQRRGQFFSKFICEVKILPTNKLISDPNFYLNLSKLSVIPLTLEASLLLWAKEGKLSCAFFLGVRLFKMWISNSTSQGR